MAYPDLPWHPPRDAKHWMPDLVFNRLRDMGWYVCRCHHPVRIFLGLWGATECGRCGKKVVEQ